MNYSLNHNFLSDPYISELKGSHQLATWMSYCLIDHFTKNMGHADFNVSKLEKAWHMKRATINKAIEGLIKVGYIKRIKVWQKKGNKPSVYVSVPRKKRTIPKGEKDYPQRHEGLVPKDRVNNYNNYIKKNDSSNKEYSSKLVVGSEEWFKDMEMKQKGEGK